jgi:tripartite-type tricarboxylate transporter receptor subunit TctC
MTAPRVARRAALLLPAAGVALATPALAQPRPITLVHGFGPGGPADLMARLIAPGIGEALNAGVVVEPRPGAGGNIAAAAVSRAAPDGATLILLTGGHAVSGAFARNLGYEPVEGFAFVALIVRYAFVVAVRADHLARDLRALLAAARASPGTVAFGSAGAGSTQHLVGEMLNAMAGVQMTHVPYRGDAASLTALLAGEVPVVMGTATTVFPQVQQGKVRVLAVTSAARSARLPGVPTVAEAALPGYEATTWAGVAAPRGTPPDLLGALNRAVVHASSQPAVRARLAEALDGEAVTSTPEGMREFVAAEVARWRGVIQARGVSVE